MKRILLLAILLPCVIGIAAAQGTRPQYVITVKRGAQPLGEITIELYPDVAPKHVHNFDSLVGVHFYDGTAFHRVIPGFMIQGGGIYSKEEGTPKSYWGYSDESQTRVPAEFSTLHHERGIISMARLGNDINSGTSQFFICVADAPHLDGSYSIFGHVLSGMDVVDTIVMSPRDASDSPNEKVEMTVVAKENSSVGADDAASASASIEARPSIAAESIALHYTAADAGHLSIALFDASGRLVRTLVDDAAASRGSHLVDVDVSSLPSGVYVAQMRSGASVKIARFVVAH